MKKKLLAIFCLTLALLALSACGGSSGGEAAATAEPSTT